MGKINNLILLLGITLLMLMGCQTERFDDSQDFGDVIDLGDGKFLVPIGVEYPVYSVIQTKSAGDEVVIKNIRVLVCANNTIIQCEEGKIDPNNSKKIEAVLKRYNGECSIQLFANIPDFLLPSFYIGQQLSAINELLLESSYLSTEAQNGIPVISASANLAKLDPSTLNGYTTALKYVYARIDIECNVSGFTFSEVTLINGAKQSRLLEGVIPADLGGEESRNTIAVANNKVQKIYLFENNEIRPDTQEKNTTDLILKINEGYYKICVTYKDNNLTDFYSIQRGNKYNVVIKAVNGPGYTSFEEAKNNKPANIDYNITVDDGRSKDIIISNGSYYLGVTNSEFYIFADEAKGVTATYLSHNAPSTVTNATISVSGEGVTLRASEGYSLTSPTSAMLDLRNGTVQNIPVKLDFTSSSIPKNMTIRIGDLEKVIKIVRGLNSADLTPYEIPSYLYKGTDFKTFTSLSDRLKIDARNNMIMDNSPKYSDRNYVFAYATAFAGVTRKNVLFAVKRIAQEVIYYEKYVDGSYGFSFQDGTYSSLDMGNKKVIIECGYGVANLSTLGSSTLKIGNVSFECLKRECDSIWTDYAEGSIYLVNQMSISSKIFKNSNAEEVFFASKSTTQFVFPYFAKGVYGSSALNDGIENNPHKIRTPLHFRQIIKIDASNKKYYLQEHDIDFSKPEVGGVTLAAPVFEYEDSFQGGYDGTSNKLQNMKIRGTNDGKYSSIFEYNTGLIKNMHFVNCQLDGYQHSGFITGDNYENGRIENCLIENSQITNEYRMAGYIVGANSGSINNCMVIANSSENKCLINYYDFTGAIAGENRGSILNVVVVDVNSNSFNATPVVSSYYYSDRWMGGITGNNGGSLTNALFVGGCPTDGTNIFPFTGNKSDDNQNILNNCYFVYMTLNPDNLFGGGIAKPISGFGLENLPTEYWIKDNLYPYPRLKSFDPPKGWPGKK